MQRKPRRGLWVVERLETRTMLTAVPIRTALVTSDARGGPLPIHAHVDPGYVTDPSASQSLGADTSEHLLSAVPSYLWHDGCGPTAAGMVIGYWDGHGGSNFVSGDASTQTLAVNAMIASSEHYNDYALPIDTSATGLLPDKSTLGGAHANNCVADWMKTSWSAASNYYGWSYFSDVPTAMTQYAAYRGYTAATSHNEAYGTLIWSDLTGEIDAGRPMLFLIDTNGDNTTDHFVPVIGYDDSNTTFACYNTWDRAVHWYPFRQMESGRTWGVYGGTFFDPGVLNHPPTQITLSQWVVGEQQPVGTTLGTLTTSDPESWDTFTYSLVDGDVSSFSISGNVLKTAEVFDSQSRRTYNITIRSTDDGGLSIDVGFRITVVPRVMYVDVNAPAAGADGMSWNTAYRDLRLALAGTVSGTELRVADGVYRPTTTLDRNATFQIKSGVSVRGGFAGYGATNPDLRDPDAYPTVLSGDIGNAGAKSDNSYHVVLFSATDALAGLDGVTVTAGNANGSISSQTRGGGIYCSSSRPTISNCMIIGNSANNGAGLGNNNSLPIIINSVISDNVSTSFGGGVYNTSACSPTLTNCTICGNVAASGGGIYDDDSASVPVLANDIVWGNIAATDSQIHSGTLLSVTNSDVQGGYSGSANLDQDPLFTRAPGAGPDGLWGTTDDDPGNLRVHIGSPCVDAGDNGSVPAAVAGDLLGHERFVDVPTVHDPGKIVDLGAYEHALPLAASTGEFQFDAARQSICLTFNAEILPASAQAGDLVLNNLTTGQVIDCCTLSLVTWDRLVNSATWAFSVVLPDGNYRACLPAGCVNDCAGDTMGSEFAFDFFAFGGDADHNRFVDLQDLYALASNWKGNGKVFSQGDFNYDGKVDAADLGILSRNWQRSLPAAPPPAAPTSLTAPRRTATRVLTLIQ